jgi:hypothetical protein
MFGFGKKKYINNFEKADKFLESYAVKVVSLMPLTKENETVTKALNKLKESFVFAITPPQNKEVIEYQKKIETRFTELENVLEEGDWDEADVLRRISLIEKALIGLTAVIAK